MSSQAPLVSPIAGARTDGDPPGRDRRLRLLAVLDAALEADPDDRTALLALLCGGDDVLRRQVEELLALADDTEGFLAEPAVTFRTLAAGEAAAELEPGTRLGPYRIAGLLARGGMGSVYRAVREDDFEKVVAIKLIQGGLESEAAERRFHAERQILARLEHPAIARLLDGGTTADGRPYLVMEHVDGTPITEHCAAESLSLRERLELFCRMLPAVAAAHQSLVVHRDLKPSNILVTREGVPKLLDFGIAKALDPADPSAARTLTLESPLTPRYASPEQVQGGTITTASDVYSLGVLLHELLTGRLPSDLDECPRHELAWRICHREADRPSSLVRGKQRRALEGDLDAIVLKALRKEPRERYASVEQLADDLQRYLEGLPVRARRGAWAYRTSKLLRRHKALAAAAVLIVVAGVTSTVLWWRAEEERARADHERAEAVSARERSERVSEFLKDLFRSADPDRARGRQLSAEEILEAGRRRLTAGLEEDPELAAQLAGTLGDVYRELGLYDQALELLERSVALRRALYPEGHADLAVALNDLASVDYYLGRYELSAERFREVLELWRRLGTDAERVATASSNLASALKQTGEHEEAGERYREALALRESLHGPDAPEVAASLYALGALLYERGQLAEAVVPLRRALEIRRRVLGEKHTGVATVLNTLGRALHAAGELAEAESAHRRALEIRLELLGGEHAHVALTRRDLAAVLLERGENEPAGSLLREALESLRGSRSPGDWTIASVESLWGGYLASVGRLEEAKPYLERSYAALRAAKGETSIYSRQARQRLAALEAGQR